MISTYDPYSGSLRPKPSPEQLRANRVSMNFDLWVKHKTAKSTENLFKALLDVLATNEKRMDNELHYAIDILRQYLTHMLVDHTTLTNSRMEDTLDILRNHGNWEPFIAVKDSDYLLAGFILQYCRSWTSSLPNPSLYFGSMLDEWTGATGSFDRHKTLMANTAEQLFGKDWTLLYEDELLEKSSNAFLLVQANQPPFIFHKNALQHTASAHYDALPTNLDL